MKHILLTITLSLSILSGFAQGWQATNLTNVAYLAITELETFDNNLYAIVNNGFAGTLNKLDAGNTSWTELTITGTTGIPAFLKAANGKFYIGTVGLGESNLYVSTDGINYTLADTTGLPQVTGGFNRMYGLDYFNGKLLINLGSSGYWISNEGQGNWVHIDVATLLNGGGNPVAYLNGKLFAHDSQTLYMSTDYGTNWPAITTDLPAGFTANKLISDPTIGRLYTDGGNGNDYGLYYSDNEGANWTEIDISAFITTDYQGGQQIITSLYAKGQTVYFGLENDISPSHPNIVGTTSGLSNFAVDTVGLPPNATGTVNALHFAEYNGKLAVSLAVIDAYLKDIGTGMEEADNSIAVNLYPNPANDVLTVNTTEKITSIDIINQMGQVVLSQKFNTKSINVSSLAKGMYFIRFNSDDEVLGTKPFVKK